MLRQMRLARFFGLLLPIVARLSIASASAQSVAPPPPLSKLDPIIQSRIALTTGKSKVILRAAPGKSIGELASAIRRAGGQPGRPLSIINGHAATVLNVTLAALASNPAVKSISADRLISGSMERTGATVGATAVREQLGYDGKGIGIAVIDSGVSAWHDDLGYTTGGGQRVERFIDFIGGRATPYDDYGHGTHVAGIIAGNGFDSSGARSGIAPGAHLVVLKALDATGSGVISDVIAAMEYVVAHRAEHDIRVLNLSIATGVYESYNTDPLTVAALQVVKAGIVVCAAAGNNGRSSKGEMLYGGITAPGNAPWVLTVGASSHMGTTNRADDTMAAFSSRGPSAIDTNAKPDLVAPGVGIESLSDPYSAFYKTKSSYLLPGTVATSYLPYLSLSGTSMAAPVVSGTIALMLQANPSLTPNAVKGILQYTAEQNDGYDPMTEGSGFLNTQGAVTLARYLANPSNGAYPSSASWSMNITWGNYRFHGGRLTADANAWATSVSWGQTQVAGQTPEWGVVCSTSSCDGSGGTWIRWDTTADSRNVVWGDACNGANCSGTWSISAANSVGVVVWGTIVDEIVVWGTNDVGIVVWGTSDDGDMVVWGTTCRDSSCKVIWTRR
jgi:serine protease AprX